jgi:hypothetical protein
MSKRGVTVLLLLAIVIALGALIQDCSLQSADRIASARLRARSPSMCAILTDLTLAMQGAQRGYVGQDRRRRIGTAA